MIIEQAIWPVIELSDLITDMQPGFAQRPRQDDGGVPQLRTNNVSNFGTIDLSEVKYVLPSKAELDKYSVRRGDVIFNNTNSPDLVGRAAYFDLDEHFVLSNHMTRLRVVDELVDAEYLARYLHYLWQIGASLRWAKQWVNQAAIDQNGLSRFLIPLPPLPEQRRIVAILRQADELRQLRRQANERAKDLLPALFHEMFGPHRAVELNWRNRPLSHYGQVSYGFTVNQLRRSAYPTYPYLRVANVQRWSLDLSEIAEIGILEGDLDKYLLTKGDVLVVEGHADPRQLGRAASWNVEIGECLHQNHLLRIRPYKDQAISTYLVGYINSDLGQRYMLRYGKTSSGLNTINSQVLADMPVPDIPLELQREFERRYHAWQNVLSKSDVATTRLDSMVASLLARAFTGELTAAWREAHTTELAEAAAARDRLLGATAHLRHRAAVDLETEVGQEVFAETLDQIVVPSTQQLLNNLGSPAALVATLQESPFAQMSRQLQEAAQINANLVNAEIFRSVSSLAESTQIALAQAVAPIRQAQSGLAQFVDTIEATQRTLQSTNIAWALQLAETAASIMRRPDPDHPRYGLLRDLSEDQYETYVAIRSADRYATAEMLAEEMEWSAQRVAQNLTLLAAAGLVQSAAFPTQPTGDQVEYVLVYRALQPSDDVWSDDLRRLAELSA